MKSGVESEIFPTFFLQDEASIMLTDIREGYCDSLRKKFGDNKTLLGIETMNLIDADFELKFSTYFGNFDTVFALNVV